MPERPDPRLPRLNQRVLVRVGDDEADVASRVEDVDGEDVVLAAPLRPEGGPVEGSVGMAVRVRWAGPVGPSTIVGVLVGASASPVPVWRVRPISFSSSPQRREHVRGAFDGAVTIRGGEAAAAGELLDLSEGGLRAEVAGEPALHAGDHVVAGFAVDGLGVLATAEVVEVAGDEGPDGERVSQVRLRFRDVDDRQRDRIRSAVFRRQRRTLRR